MVVDGGDTQGHGRRKAQKGPDTQGQKGNHGGPDTQGQVREGQCQ